MTSSPRRARSSSPTPSQSGVFDRFVRFLLRSLRGIRGRLSSTKRPLHLRSWGICRGFALNPLRAHVKMYITMKR
eukprot:3218747-Pyramimonas_sp.AAC.1